ncbi:Domain of uncharacterised function (DUF1871) [Mycobacteroides abscessus subsp. abscessus]|nr:Domain of uncharacterised function (DUF1871) [Mycobacteroides abscessus subsp. abscessus]
MNSQEMNIEFVRLLNEWDPFLIGEGNYDTEIADSLQALLDLELEKDLANAIQAIYEFSFDESIPITSCLAISKKLMAVKHSGTCSF